MLAKAISTNAASSGSSPNFMRLEGVTLRLNTRSVIQRLLSNPEFKRQFEPGGDAGFVRDLEMPPFGMTAKLGGRLLPGSEFATTQGIEKLREAVAAELDALPDGLDFNALTFPSLKSALNAFGASVGERMPEQPKTATVVPVHFAAPGRKADERTDDIARVLSAIETVDGRDWLEVLLTGVAKQLRNDGQDEEFIDEVVGAIRTQRARPGSQVCQLLDFLDDDALSRVRHQVTMRLMESVAAALRLSRFYSTSAQHMGWSTIPTSVTIFAKPSSTSVFLCGPSGPFSCLRLEPSPSAGSLQYVRSGIGSGSTG
jgi:hypothetical protein